MPKVGTGKNVVEFDYTPEGVAEAEAYAEATGLPITNAPDIRENYQWGGMVLPPQGLPQVGGRLPQGLGSQPPAVGSAGLRPSIGYEKGGKVEKGKKGY